MQTFDRYESQFEIALSKELKILKTIIGNQESKDANVTQINVVVSFLSLLAVPWC